jgi:two-component system sensor histidine kinase ResE
VGQRFSPVLTNLLYYLRLYRGKNAILLEPNQSGVGLYTAKRIIELHGGTISLNSTLGKGTTVVVTLPK